MAGECLTGVESPLMDMAAMREHYDRMGLSVRDMDDDPIVQFRKWFDDWLACDPYDANAVIVATTDADGWPSARAVLLKGCDERGFVFYTNRNSAKGRDLEASGRAALCFLWHPLERQVRVVGSAVHAPDEESDAYFASRPRGAQIGAWASPQSAVINNRAMLEDITNATARRFAADGEDSIISRPPHWGGYLVRPHSVEFWQGRRDRLHDRLRYRRPVHETHRPTHDSNWSLERLAP